MVRKVYNDDDYSDQRRPRAAAGHCVPAVELLPAMDRISDSVCLLIRPLARISWSEASEWLEYAVGVRCCRSFPAPLDQ